MMLKRFRIVYDGTCKSDKGLSLNDVQLIGERLQDELVTLMMRFRCHAVAISADIRKMYLQVRVNPEQWDLQRVFWRPSATDAIRVLVNYGHVWNGISTTLCRSSYDSRSPGVSWKERWRSNMISIWTIA